MSIAGTARACGAGFSASTVGIRVGQTQTLYLDQGSLKPNRVFQVKSGLIGEVARLPERIVTMRRTVAVVGTAIFFVFVPCVLAGLVPWWISRWEFRLSFLGVELTRFVAAALILASVAGLVDSFVRFALQGLGTPAPIAPTQHLVVTGLYRYVRNPMYVAVAAVIFGQAVLFGDWRLFAYGALFCLVCHLFVVGYEEPTLKKSFGAEYEAFLINVPRWIPRLTAWLGGR